MSRWWEYLETGSTKVLILSAEDVGKLLQEGDELWPELVGKMADIVIVQCLQEGRPPLWGLVGLYD